MSCHERPTVLFASSSFCPLFSAGTNHLRIAHLNRTLQHKIQAWGDLNSFLWPSTSLWVWVKVKNICFLKPAPWLCFSLCFSPTFPSSWKFPARHQVYSFSMFHYFTLCWFYLWSSHLQINTAICKYPYIAAMWPQHFMSKFNCNFLPKALLSRPLLTPLLSLPTKSVAKTVLYITFTNQSSTHKLHMPRKSQEFYECFQRQTN